jgi:hypothetical protein
MTVPGGDLPEVERDVAELLARTIEQLDAAGAPDEALAMVKAPRRLWPFTSAPVLVPSGRAWRLGVLLLDRQARLYATGQLTRAVEPLRGVTNRSHEAELRRADRRAAVRGHFPTGEAVNFGFSPIALDAASLAAGSGPLVVVDGTVMVRWDATHPDHGLSRLESYLADRADLLSAD